MNEEIKATEKDTFFKRTWRGFKILCSKIASAYKNIVSSDFVQNIKDNNEKSDPNEFMPNYSEQFSSDDNYQWSMFDEKDKKKSNVI